ncbi:ead/Ea22-like family protein [Klebsiella pneumoniae]|nr:ead/Ea22-like family protein [Klebsiella pneumoniae]
MTTDITELAQREKFEAWWERTQHNGNPPRFGWSRWRDGEGYKVDDDDSELDGMWEAWKAAGAELVEALEKAQQERDNWRTSFDNERFRADKLKAHIDDIEPIRAAAEKLVRCKGRYHSELNYRALAALFGVTAPDLPPLDGESRTVTVKTMRPGHITVGGERMGIYMRDEVDEFMAALSAAGIKVEGE